MGRLDGKRMVITGSSRSLGREFALACAHEGASLVLNGTNQDALISVLKEVTDLGAPARACLLYTSPSPRDRQKSRMPSSA